MWSAQVLTDDPALVRLIGSALSPDMEVAARDGGTPSPAEADLLVIDQRSRAAPVADAGRAAVVVLVGGQDFSALEAALVSRADDAIRVPVDQAELRARSLAAVRRRSVTAGGDAADVPWYDRRRREVQGADGVRRRLTRSECVLLERLLETPGRVVSREALLWCLADRPLDVESNVVERHVATLRRKLRDSRPMPRYIETVQRCGYRVPLGSLRSGND